MDPSPSTTGHPPSDALVWVVEQNTDNIQQAGEKLEGEIEEPDPQACWEGNIRAGASRSRPGPRPLSTARALLSSPA